MIQLQVPSAAANFVELEALRWENRKLADAKLVAETQARIRSPSIQPKQQIYMQPPAILILITIIMIFPGLCSNTTFRTCVDSCKPTSAGHVHRPVPGPGGSRELATRASAAERLCHHRVCR